MATRFGLSSCWPIDVSCWSKNGNCLPAFGLIQSHVSYRPRDVGCSPVELLVSDRGVLVLVKSQHQVGSSVCFEYSQCWK